MKNCLKSLSIIVLLLLAPAVTFAGINKLDGLGDTNQLLATSSATTTMHMKISNSGTDTHRFDWDGTPWRVNQGGTGTTSFSNGSVLFYNNNS